LYRSLVWAFLFKHYSLTDCAEFLEIYGLPMRVGTYPNNASAGDKRTLLRALVGLGHDAAAIVPEGMLIEFKEAAKVGGDVFLPFAEYMDRAMSKAIVGQTLSAQSGGSQGGGGGSHALGKVHADVQRDILLSDARQVASTINRDLIAPLIQYNVGAIDPARMPRFVFDDTEPEDMALLADALPKLASAGLEIDVDYVHKRLKIPRAEAGATLLKGAAPAMPFGGGAGFGGDGRETGDSVDGDGDKPAKKDEPADDETPLTGRYKRLHSLAAALNQAQPMDAASHMEALMHREAQAEFMATMDDVRLLVANATNAEQLQDDLLRLYGELDPTALGERIALGMTALTLRGMADVTNEADAAKAKATTKTRNKDKP
jgi:phage gp29-like protein